MYTVQCVRVCVRACVCILEHVEKLSVVSLSSGCAKTTKHRQRDPCPQLGYSEYKEGPRSVRMKHSLSETTHSSQFVYNPLSISTVLPGIETQRPGRWEGIVVGH